MIDFNPGPYAELANTATGVALWQYLNSQAVLEQLLANTAAKRPAIAELEKPLLAQFGKEINTAQHVLMINRMIRQIMTAYGYKKEPRPMKLIGGNLFSKGIRFQLIAKTEAITPA